MDHLLAILADGPFYAMPLWGKVVGPVLLILFGGGLIAVYFIFSRKMAPTKPNAKLAWYHRAWQYAALVVGIIAVIIAIGYAVAAADPSFLGINGGDGN